MREKSFECEKCWERVEIVSEGDQLGQCSPVGVGAGADGGSLLELGCRVLRQVSHHGLLVDVRVGHFIGLDELGDAEPVVSLKRRESSAICLVEGLQFVFLQVPWLQ